MKHNASQIQIPIESQFLDVHGSSIAESPIADHAEARFRQLIAIIDRNARKSRIIPVVE